MVTMIVFVSGIVVGVVWQMNYERDMPLSCLLANHDWERKPQKPQSLKHCVKCGRTEFYSNNAWWQGEQTLWEDDNGGSHKS